MPLYAGKLITADPNVTGLQVARLAEAVPSLDNGLWQLLPDDSEARKKGFDSGVR